MTTLNSFPKINLTTSFNQIVVELGRFKNCNNHIQRCRQTVNENNYYPGYMIVGGTRSFGPKQKYPEVRNINFETRWIRVYYFIDHLHF